MENANYLDEVGINFMKENDMLTYLIFAIAISYCPVILSFHGVGSQSMEALINSCSFVGRPMCFVYIYR